jgi:hypothetical protein
MTTKIDFEKLFPQGNNGRSEDVQFAYDFAIDQQKKGILDDVEILKQCAQHLADQSGYELTKRIIKINKEISAGIEELSKLERFGSLRSIAEHALEECAKVLSSSAMMYEGDELPHHAKQGVKAARIILGALRKGWSSYGEVFTPEFLAEYEFGVESKEDNEKEKQ